MQNRLNSKNYNSRLDTGACILYFRQMIACFPEEERCCPIKQVCTGLSGSRSALLRAIVVLKRLYAPGMGAVGSSECKSGGIPNTFGKTLVLTNIPQGIRKAETYKRHSKLGESRWFTINVQINILKGHFSNVRIDAPRMNSETSNAP